MKKEICTEICINTSCSFVGEKKLCVGLCMYVYLHTNVLACNHIEKCITRRVTCLGD